MGVGPPVFEVWVSVGDLTTTNHGIPYNNYWAARWSSDAKKTHRRVEAGNAQPNTHCP